jgi:hypothetical protein
MQGCPKIIQSDNGSIFTSDFFAAVTENLFILKVRVRALARENIEILPIRNASYYDTYKITL